MNNVLTRGAELNNNPAIVYQVAVLNSREFAACRSVLTNGYGIKRSELYILNRRTGKLVTRKTLWEWDCILQAHPKMVNYRRDSTQQSLWNPGQAWNPHQVWCLEKVADFMATKAVYRNTESKKRKYKSKGVLRFPTYEELNQYLSINHEKFTHKQFLKERFGYVNEI